MHARLAISKTEEAEELQPIIEEFWRRLEALPPTHHDVAKLNFTRYLCGKLQPAQANILSGIIHHVNEDGALDFLINDIKNNGILAKNMMEEFFNQDPDLLFSAVISQKKENPTMMPLNLKTGRSPVEDFLINGGAEAAALMRVQNPERIYQAGLDCCDGPKKNFNQAYEYFRVAAHQGHALAGYILAEFYLAGIGVKENVWKALHWYKMAARQGFWLAQLALMHFYTVGFIVECNTVTAYSYFCTFADKLDKSTIIAYVQKVKKYLINNKDKVEFHWMKKTADNVLSIIDYMLSQYCLRNKELENNPDIIKLLQSAAGQGFSQAQFELGVCYLKGFYVDADDSEAFTWFLKSAEEGNVCAQYQLALCYRDGVGTDSDSQFYLRWLWGAARNQHLAAWATVGSHYFYGNYLERDENRAFSYFMFAAKRGEVESQYYLGVCYERGIGTEKDLKKSIKWYESAANQAHPGAMNALQMLFKKLPTYNHSMFFKRWFFKRCKSDLSLDNAISKESLKFSRRNSI